MVIIQKHVRDVWTDPILKSKHYFDWYFQGSLQELGSQILLVRVSLLWNPGSLPANPLKNQSIFNKFASQLPLSSSSSLKVG